MSMLLAYLTAEIRHRWQVARATRDAGYTTESVLVTALLVALALAVMATIAAIVQAKAGSLDLG